MRLPDTVFASSALVLLIFVSGGCAPAEPSWELTVYHRWVAATDREVMRYVCPEAQRAPLEAADPLNAATHFVQRGSQLQIWATETIDPTGPAPANIAASLNSLRASISIIATSFVPAVATAASHRGECYGRFALNCDKVIRARDVLTRIDPGTLAGGREDYFTHRAALAKVFSKADLPLSPLKTCG